MPLTKVQTEMAGTGSVLQVVSTTVTSQQTFGAGTSDITGLSATITPKSSTNKILVIVNVSYSTVGNLDAAFQTLRNASVIPAPR